MKLDIRYPSHPQDAKWYDTEKLRRQYLIEKVFEKDEALLTYSHFDRIIAGGIMPVDTKVALTGGKELASQYFLERREMGIINVGGPGRVYADSDTYELAPRDGLYLGMSIKTLEFESLDPANPAKYWINSCPAHQTYPNKKINIKDAAKRPLGSVETCNKRVINQYIHPAVLKTCQLCMGLTELEPGSNWNSMPCHTHERRMEVYFYFNLGDNIMFHMMGQPQETRHIITAHSLQ